MEIQNWADQTDSVNRAFLVKERGSMDHLLLLHLVTRKLCSFSFYFVPKALTIMIFEVWQYKEKTAIENFGTVYCWCYLAVKKELS